VSAVRLRHFTDPGCPFAFSAEPSRWKLRWLFGDQLEWETRMVVLSESPDDYLEKGFTPDKQSSSLRRLQREHGMPIDPAERPRMAATAPACRAVVATRLNKPEKADAILRRLRVRAMSGELLDDPQTLAGAANDVGLDPEELRRWCDDRETEERLEDDKRIARQPIEAARALDHKLAETEDGRRYTCPSYELEHDGAKPRAIPGFQPFATYEVALANVAPELERREKPESVEDVLRWAGEPLATAEVAALCELDLAHAREELARVATEEPVGADGYWSLPA
jgi:predicted DsbA family dithiol-disulfide isomerase